MRKPLTFRLPPETIERVRGVVAAVQEQKEPGFTSQDFGELAVEHQLERFEKALGSPVPAREKRLSTGPRPKSATVLRKKKKR